MRERLQRTAAGTGDRLGTTSVVDQGIDCLLQHTLLVLYDDRRCSQLQQLLQTVVAGDDTAVEIIEVAGGETSAVQLQHRTQIRWNDRDDRQHHPLRLVAGTAEGLDRVQTLDQFFMLLALCIFHGFLDGLVFLFKVDILQQGQRSLCTGLGHKAARTVDGHIFTVFLFRQYLLVFQLRIARIGNDPGDEVDDFLQLLRCDIQQQRHTGRNAAQIPDVRDRRSQLDVSHTFTAHRRLGDLDAAAIADHAFIANLFILSAVTFPVLARTEDALTEQTVPFRFLRTVVDRFRLFDLSVAPLVDALRRS